MLNSFPSIINPEVPIVDEYSSARNATELFSIIDDRKIHHCVPALPGKTAIGLSGENAISKSIGERTEAVKPYKSSLCQREVVRIDALKRHIEGRKTSALC